jgi:hypothetical protein
MLKKTFTVFVLLSATSLTLIQTQQPAQAGFIDDLSAFLKGTEAGAELVEGLNQATNSDGSVDVRQIIRSSQRAVGRLKEVADEAPEPQYHAEEPEYKPDTSEVQNPEYQSEESVSEASEDSETEGQSEDTFQ